MAHKAPSEHEMTEAAQDNVDFALSASIYSDKTHSSSLPRSPKIRDFLRHIRLQLLGKTFSKSFSWRKEPRKVALYRSRRIAAFHCLLHVIPLGGAITLLVLRWAHYWIGSTPPDSTILQFVAKFHELLMQVSIAEVMLCIVRMEALHSFVPLGALSGAIQATRLSYLWSIDFLSMFTSKSFRGRGWRRAGMIIAIPALFVSTALVGPSSAVLMIPGPGCPKMYADLGFHVGSNDFLFPTYLGRLNGLDMNLVSMNLTLQSLEARSRLSMSANLRENNPAYGYRKSEASLPYQTLDLVRLLRSSWREVYETVLPGHNPSWIFTEATSIIPMNFVQKMLSYKNEVWRALVDDERDRFDLLTRRKNATFTVTMPHPVTTVACMSHRNKRPMEPKDNVFYVQEDGTSFGVLGNVSSVAPQVTSRGVRNMSTQYLEPIWLASPEPNSQALIGVFSTAVPGDSGGDSDPEERHRHYFLVSTCRVSAYWNTAEVQSYMEGDEDLGLNMVAIESVTEMKLRDVRKITLNITGFEQLSDPISLASIGGDKTVFLSAAFAIAMSELTLPTNTFTEQGSSEDIAMRVRATQYGYGYCTDATSVRSALAIIMAYCIITMLYLSYILITGSTSTAWNSAIELVTLALQSKKPDHQGNIAVGIDSIDTFNQGVGIRVNKDNELELVFASDRDFDSRELRKIERNKEY